MDLQGYFLFGLLFGVLSGGYLGRKKGSTRALLIWYVLGFLAWPITLPLAIVKAIFTERW